MKPTVFQAVLGSEAIPANHHDVILDGTLYNFGFALLMFMNYEDNKLVVFPFTVVLRESV